MTLLVGMPIVTDDFREERELSKSEPAQLERMKARYREVTASVKEEPVVGSAPLKGAPPGRRW
jgi:hypothetical protein